MIHVYPVNDWVDHELQGTMCICEPKVDFDLGIVIHNSADGREYREKDNELYEE